MRQNLSFRSLQAPPELDMTHISVLLIKLQLLSFAHVSTAVHGVMLEKQLQVRRLTRPWC